MSTQLASICIGHSRKINSRIEGGAISVSGMCEWSYNKDLASMIVDELGKYQIDTLVITEYEGGNYGSAQRWLADWLKKAGATMAIELHFNSSDSADANGHEMLYWHTSKRGLALAEDLSTEFCTGVPELKSRGTKPLNAASRGSQFVSGTHCPAVIVESFFGSSPSDWKIAAMEKRRIAKSIAEGIASFLD